MERLGLNKGNQLKFPEDGDCCAFGMQMSGRTFSGSEGYEFGYQGMLKDDEWSGDGNTYTTEFRQYDSRLGRWMVVDPMTHIREWLSSYNFVQYNPIYRLDPTGAVDNGYTVDEDGNIEEVDKTGGDESQKLMKVSPSLLLYSIYDALTSCWFRIFWCLWL